MSLIDFYAHVGFAVFVFVLALATLASLALLFLLADKASKVISARFTAWREARSDRKLQENLERLMASHEWKDLVHRNEELELTKQQILDSNVELVMERNELQEDNKDLGLKWASLVEFRDDLAQALSATKRDLETCRISFSRQLKEAKEHARLLEDQLSKSMRSFDMRAGGVAPVPPPLGGPPPFPPARTYTQEDF